MLIDGGLECAVGVAGQDGDVVRVIGSVVSDDQVWDTIAVDIAQGKTGAVKSEPVSDGGAEIILAHAGDDGHGAGAGHGAYRIVDHREVGNAVLVEVGGDHAGGIPVEA